MWLFHEAKYGFIAMRRKAYVISALTVFLTLDIAAMAANIFADRQLAELRGGLHRRCRWCKLRFEQTITAAELRSRRSGGPRLPRFTRFDNQNDEFVIRAPLAGGCREVEQVVGRASAAQIEADVRRDRAFEVDAYRESVGTEDRRRARAESSPRHGRDLLPSCSR